MTEEDLAKLAGGLGLLRPGTPDGPALRAWRRILTRHAETMGYKPADLPAAGAFDAPLERWTRQFQNDAYLARVDGVVGPVTWGAALRRYPDEAAALAAPPTITKAAVKAAATQWPVQTRAAVPPAERDARFGPPGAEEQMVRVAIPELVGIPGGPDSGVVLCHPEAAPKLRALFAAWREEGLLRWVLTFDGGFQNRRARPKAGSPQDPAMPPPWSAHAYGIAFDINADWNLVGHPPARLEERGSVLRLVETAQRCGFWWGGFDRDRPDGSHFEVGGEAIPVARAEPAPEPARAARTQLRVTVKAAARKPAAAPVGATAKRPSAKAAPKAGGKAAGKKASTRKAPARKAAAPKAAARKPAARPAAKPAAPRRRPAPKGKGRG